MSILHPSRSDTFYSCRSKKTVRFASDSASISSANTPIQSAKLHPCATAVVSSDHKNSNSNANNNNAKRLSPQTRELWKFLDGHELKTQLPEIRKNNQHVENLKENSSILHSVFAPTALDKNGQTGKRPLKDSLFVNPNTEHPERKTTGLEGGSSPTVPSSTRTVQYSARSPSLDHGGQAKVKVLRPSVWEEAHREDFEDYLR